MKQAHSFIWEKEPHFLSWEFRACAFIDHPAKLAPGDLSSRSQSGSSTALCFRKKPDRFWISANQKDALSSKKEAHNPVKEATTPGGLFSWERSYSFSNFNLEPACVSKTLKKKKKKTSFCDIEKVTSLSFRFSIWQTLLTCKAWNSY